MTKTPLNLDIASLLSAAGDAPSPELEVVPASASPMEASDGDAAAADVNAATAMDVDAATATGVDAATATDVDAATAELSDQALEERKKRLRDNIRMGLADKLPDKGAKLRRSLSNLSYESDRRKLARLRKEDEERTARSLEVSKSPEVSVCQDVPSPKCTNSVPRKPSSFISLLSEKLGWTATHKTCGTLKDDREQKHGRLRLNRAKPTKVPVSQCASSIGSRSTYKLSGGDLKKIWSSKISSSHAGKSLLSHSPKKKRVLACSGSLHQQPKKVQHVVLLDEEEVSHPQMIHYDVPDDWKEAKVYYPSRDDRESIELSYPDIKCLDPRQYLSSPIMNFYIRYLQRPVSSAGKTRDGCYFFNTYFYKKLEEAILNTGDQSANFLKLRRWWKGVNIFQKAYIFLPIHKEAHWSLVIICIPAKEDESGPILLHLDSLDLHESHAILSVVDRCLELEWNCMRQEPPSDVPVSKTVWRALPRWMEKKPIKVPRQENDYDCGLFVLYFIERFLEEAPERLKKEDLSSMFGQKWFNPRDASGLRERMRAILVEEFENARFENGRTSSPSSSCGSSCGSPEEIDMSELDK